MSRRGLHKLECPCGRGVYMTVPELERGAPPACPSCGEPFAAAELELAMMLLERYGLDSPAVAEFRRQASSVMHGQASHWHGGRELRSPDLIAAERVERDRREAAAQRRLNALLPVPEPMPF